jgi:DNA invertase Pin-like site-specific DNA recombinase
MKKDKNPKHRTVAYLRVSTSDQDTEKNKHSILVYANKHDLGKVDFIEETASGKKNWRERKIAGIIDGLTHGDKIIVAELSRLGRSTIEVLEILREAKGKGIAIYSVKEGLELNGDGMQSKIMSTILALVADLERDFISERTKEGLKARKAAGVVLGRPKGPGKSRLDEYKDEIIALLKNGSTKRFIAKKYKTTLPNLYNWLNKHNIDAKPVL